LLTQQLEHRAAAPGRVSEYCRRVAQPRPGPLASGLQIVERGLSRPHQIPHRLMRSGAQTTVDQASCRNPTRRCHAACFFTDLPSLRIGVLDLGDKASCSTPLPQSPSLNFDVSRPTNTSPSSAVAALLADGPTWPRIDDEPASVGGQQFASIGTPRNEQLCLNGLMRRMTELRAAAQGRIAE
jgi:hypothetical protein